MRIHPIATPAFYTAPDKAKTASSHPRTLDSAPALTFQGNHTRRPHLRTGLAGLALLLTTLITACSTGGNSTPEDSVPNADSAWVEDLLSDAQESQDMVALNTGLYSEDRVDATLSEDIQDWVLVANMYIYGSDNEDNVISNNHLVDDIGFLSQHPIYPEVLDRFLEVETPEEAKTFYLFWVDARIAYFEDGMKQFETEPSAHNPAGHYETYTRLQDTVAALQEHRTLAADMNWALGEGGSEGSTDAE